MQARQERRTRLLIICMRCSSAGNQYQQLAATNHLDNFPAAQQCGQATKDDLVSLYDDKFVRMFPGAPHTSRSGALRRMVSVRCVTPPVSTLDHYLPKAKFPLGCPARNLVSSLPDM